MGTLGLKITLSGIVVFLFFILLHAIGRSEPKTKGYEWFGVCALLGLIAIPAGALIAIWGAP